MFCLLQEMLDKNVVLHPNKRSMCSLQYPHLLYSSVNGILYFLHHCKMKKKKKKRNCLKFEENQAVLQKETNRQTNKTHIINSINTKSKIS